MGRVAAEIEGAATGFMTSYLLLIFAAGVRQCASSQPGETPDR
jgi:hypothetical protein